MRYCTILFTLALLLVAQSVHAQDWVLTLDRIGPVRFGMTLTEARHAAGALVVGEQMEGGSYIVRPRNMPMGIDLRMYEGRIDGVIVTSPVVHTLSGIRIGSTEAEVRRTYGSRVRSAPVDDNDESGGTRLIFEASNPADRSRLLVFDIHSGRVVKMFTF